MAKIAPSRKVSALDSLIFLVFASFLGLLPPAAQANAEATAELPTVTSPHQVEAGTLLLQADPGQLQVAPTVDTDVEMNINGLVARVSVTQKFENPGDQWRNGIYVFPLPETAAVDHLKMTIGERVIEGQIQTRKEARKTYETAKRAGKKASLVEQQRPNLFTNRVANIGPGERVAITIEYQQTVEYEHGRFSLRFPMTVGVRYIPGTPQIAGFDGGGWSLNTDQVPDASSITPPVTPAGVGHDNPVSLTIRLDAGLPLADIKSPYHAITLKEPGEHRYLVTLADQIVPAVRDFELTWTPQPGQAPRAALFTQRLQDETYGLLMMMPPEVNWAKQTALTREMVFVIDTSGSMSGSSIDQAREALLLGLDRLKPADRFNVIEFNSNTRAFARNALPPTSDNLSRAKAWIRGLRADGGTEIAKALDRALDGSEHSGRVRQVIFLTDGSIGNEGALFQIIQDRLGDSRLYTVGIGAAPNSYFMREAASIGRGTFTYIGAIAEVKTRMDELFEKLEYPVLSDIEMRWASGAQADYWPNPIRDLYLHEPLVVSFKLASQESELHLKGQMNGQPWSTRLPTGSGGVATGLDVLWARNQIRSLSQQRSRGRPAEEIKTAITALGLKHHIVTRHTSLVAVDLTPSRPDGVASKDAAVPNKMPKGWTMQPPGSRLPQTATPMGFHLMLGLLFALLAVLVRRTGRIETTPLVGAASGREYGAGRSLDRGRRPLPPRQVSTRGVRQV